MVVVWSGSTWAQDTINMNQVYNGALDQPQLNAAFRLPDDTLLSGTGLDAELNEVDTYTLTGFADTGAGTVLLGPTSAADFGIPLDPGVAFEDVGVGGTSTFDVSTNYTMQLTHFDSDLIPSLDNPATIDAVYDQVFTGVRAAVGPQSSQVPTDPIDQVLASLSEFNVYGMPVLHNKMMVMDSSSLNDAANFNGDGSPAAFGDLLSGATLPELKAYLYDSPNGPTPRTPTVGPGLPSSFDAKVKTTYADFSSFTTGGTPPSLTHNPFIGNSPLDPTPASPQPGIKITHNTAQSEGNWLFDTGGAASMMSLVTAATHGVSYSTVAGEGFGETNATLVGVLPDEQFTLSLTGVGGEVKIAGFVVHELILPAYLPSDVLVHLKFTDVPILVADITVVDPNDANNTITLDGIFGMNMMFPSLLIDSSLFDTGDLASLTALLSVPMITSNFDMVSFDEPTGDILLTFNPDIVPEPMSVSILLTASTIVLLRRRTV
jgi:hypothetical protein